MAKRSSNEPEQACHLNLQNLKDVQELLVEVSYKWYDIGIQLNMNPGDLDRIQSRYSDPADCLRVMLKEWLAGTNPNPTLESLAQALESRTVKKGQLANKVRQKLLERISITQLTSTTLQYPPPQLTFPQPHVASEPLYDNSPTTSHPSQHHVTSILLPHTSSQTPSQPYMAFEPSYQPSAPTPQTPQPQVMYNPAHTSSTTSHPPVLTDQVYHHHTHPPPGYDPPYLPITPTPSQQPYHLHPYDPVYLPKAPTTSNQPTYLHPHNVGYYPRAPTAMPSDPPQLPGVPLPSIPTHSYPQTAPSNHPHMQMAMNPTPHPPHCPYSVQPHPHYGYTQNASTQPHPHPHMQMATNPTTYPSHGPYFIPPQPHYVYIQSASTPPQPHPIPSAATPKLAPMPPDPKYYLPTQRMPPLPSTPPHPHPISSAATPIQDPMDPTYHPPSQRPPTHTPFTPYTPAPQMHPVDQYAKYLRAYYRRKKLPIASKWPPTASKKYIHLAVVKKDYVSKQQADEFTKATLHGNIEDIIREKESLDFSGIGKKEDGSPAQLIIVEGGPGIGKTTFAWKVCRKWSKGKILQQYRLVVLLRLRDKRVREARKVHDLFYHSNPKLREAVAAEMEAINGESVLLLYEGYDELPGKLQTQESIFLEILYQECLPEATVLITSRPSATQFLCRQFKKSIDQHIEILGFTKDDVYTYVQSVIKDQQLHREFTQYLKCYPHIRGLMYVPLNAVIVTEIYKTTKLDKSQEFVPTTLTELYTSLTRGMLLRYLTSHNQYGKQEWKLSSFSDLPEELHKQFNTICGIAFQGILKDEFIFDDLASDFNTLDLMQSASELYVDQGAVVSHNFFHLTLQEFLAAVHVSRQTTEIQLQYFLQSTPRVYASGSLEDLDQLGYTSESFSESSRSSTPLEQLQYFIQSTPTWIEQQREQVQVREPVRERELVQERERVREPVRERERVRERGREQERGRERQQQIEPYFYERAQEEPEIKLLLQQQQHQQQRHSLSQDLDSSFTIGPSTSTSERLTSILSEAPTIVPQQEGVVPALQHRKRKSLQLIKMAHMQTTEPYTQERLHSSKQPRLQRHQLHGLMGEPESTTEHSTSSSQLPTTLASCVPESEFMETSTLPRLSDVLPELQLAEGTLLPRQGTPQALQTTPSITTQDQGRLESLQVPRPPSEPTPPRPESPAIPDTADIGRLQLETLQLEPHIPQQLLSQREIPPITNPRPVIPHTLPVSPPAGSLPYAVLTSSHFQNVVKFTAGLTKLRSLPTTSLKSILLQDDGDCQVIPLYFLHWLFEAQCISTYSEMIEEATTLTFDPRGSSMTPFDCFVLGYALSHINSTWDIDIMGSLIGDEGLEMMVAGMNYKETALPPSLKSISLNLGWCAISSVGLSHLKEMPEQVATRITVLELFGNRDISESLLTNVTSRMPLLHSNKPSELKELIRNEMQQGYVSADRTTCLASGPPGVPGVTTVSPTLSPLLPHHRRDPRFPGIIFYGDPILKVVDSDGCSLARPEIGICLHFPPKAVPDGKALHLTLWPCLSGPFVPPEGREFSSPVYLISPAFQFREDVELSINHFENLRCQEDVASMSFATTLSSTEISKSNPVYMFESLEKGEFKVISSVATINLRHFCPDKDKFCQVAATTKCQSSHQGDEPEAERAPQRRKEKYYCVQLHHCPDLAVFAVSLYQDLYLKNLKSNLNSQFPDHHLRVQSKQPVYFSGDAVELVIPEIEGWSIDPSIDPTKISQEEVNLALIDPNCDSLPASYPPRLFVTITPSAQAADGKCVLHVKGIQEEFSWSIRLTASGRSLATVPNTMQQLPQGVTSSIAGVNPSTSQANASESPLIRDDRPKVMKYLRRISSVQTLLMVGESLGLDGTKLALKVTAVTFLFDLVGDWLSRTHIVDEKGMPSWRKLIEVLEEVDETGLASDIRKDLGFN